MVFGVRARIAAAAEVPADEADPHAHRRAEAEGPAARPRAAVVHAADLGDLYAESGQI